MMEKNFDDTFNGLMESWKNTGFCVHDGSPVFSEPKPDPEEKKKINVNKFLKRICVLPHVIGTMNGTQKLMVTINLCHVQQIKLSHILVFVYFKNINYINIY